MALSVRQWRLAKEISQSTMADKLGVHINTYISWEKNPERISIGCAKQISEIFDVSLDDIDFF